MIETTKHRRTNQDVPIFNFLVIDRNKKLMCWEDIFPDFLAIILNLYHVKLEAVWTLNFICVLRIEIQQEIS